MKSRLRDAIAIVGFALFVYGAHLIYHPLGYVLAGAALVLIAHEMSEE